MHERISLISAEEKEMSNIYNAKLELEAAVLLNEFLSDGIEIIEKNKAKIELLAGELLKSETLDLKHIRKILDIPEPANKEDTIQPRII